MDADEMRPEAWNYIRERKDLFFLIITKRIDRFLYCIPEESLILKLLRPNFSAILNWCLLGMVIIWSVIILAPDDWGDGWENVNITCTVENQQMANYRLPIYRTLPIKFYSLYTKKTILPKDKDGGDV